MAEKRVSVRLAAIGGKQVRAELEGVGPQLLAGNARMAERLLAAGQLDAAFSSAPAEFRRAADDASAALRSDDLNRAVESLGALRGSEGVTLQQGVAVHSSLVLLEARLIAASEAGDPKAREAYALLKRMKQK